MKTDLIKRYHSKLFTNLNINNDNYENKVYVLPKKLDEKVAALHLGRIGANLTQLTPEQAAYLSLDQEGPYKPDHYRY